MVVGVVGLGFSPKSRIARGPFWSAAIVPIRLDWSSLSERSWSGPPLAEPRFLAQNPADKFGH
jgi:hypothetical protein